MTIDRTSSSGMRGNVDEEDKEKQNCPGKYWKIDRNRYITRQQKPSINIKISDFLEYEWLVCCVCMNSSVDTEEINALQNRKEIK